MESNCRAARSSVSVCCSVKKAFWAQCTGLAQPDPLPIAFRGQVWPVDKCEQALRYVVALLQSPLVSRVEKKGNRSVSWTRDCDLIRTAGGSDIQIDLLASGYTLWIRQDS